MWICEKCEIEIDARLVFNHCTSQSHHSKVEELLNSQKKTSLEKDKSIDQDPVLELFEMISQVETIVHGMF